MSLSICPDPIYQIIFSTGLLILSPIVTLNLTYSVEIKTTFNVSAVPYGFLKDPVFIYYGHFVNNLTWSIDVKENLVYQNFEVRTILPPNSRITIETNVMVSQSGYKVIKITLDDQPIEEEPFSHTTFETPSCIISYQKLPALDPRRTRCTPRQITGQ